MSAAAPEETSEGRAPSASEERLALHVTVVLTSAKSLAWVVTILVVTSVRVSGVFCGNTLSNGARLQGEAPS